MNPARSLALSFVLLVISSSALLSRQNTTTFAGFQLTYSAQTPIQPYLTIPLGTPSQVNVSVTFTADGAISTGLIETPFTYASGGLSLTIKSGSFNVPAGVLSLNGTVSYGSVFTVTFTDLRLNAGGIVSMGTLNAAGENVSAYGFQLRNPQLTISQSTGVCTVDALIVLPNSIGSVAATAQFSNQGGLTGISLHEWNANPAYAGFVLTETKSALAADGLTLAGNVSLPSAAGVIPYSNFKINQNGIVQPPQFGPISQQVTIAGYTVAVTSAQLQDGRFDLGGSVDLGNGNRITIGKLSFFSNGSVTAENLAFAGKFDVGGLTATSGNLSWTGNAFLVDLSLTLPSVNGAVTVTGVRIGADGSLSGGSAVVQGITMTYQSLTATVTSCAVDFKSGRVALSSVFSIEKFGTLVVDGVVITSAGVTDYGTFKIDPAKTYTVGSYAIMIQSIQKLATTGLTINAKLNVGGLAQGLSTVLNITAQGVTVQSITVTNVSTTINGFTATLSSASLGIDDTLRLDGTLTFGSYGSATFTNLTMTTGGRVCGANITMKPGISFMVGDMGLAVTRLAFNGQAISLDGTISLSDGGVITVTNANLKASGSFTDGTIMASGPITVGGFKMTLLSGTLNTNGLSINGSVSLTGFAGTMGVEGVRLSRSGATGIDRINLNNVQTKMGDFQVTLDSAHYAQGRVIAAGTAVLPSPYGTLRVTDLQINANGTVSGGQFVLTGSAVTYGGVALSLTEARLQNNAVTISGTFNLQKQGVSGTVTGLTLTGAGVQSTGLIRLNQATFTVSTYTFILSSCTINDNKISIDGSMKAGTVTINAKGLTLNALGIFSGATLSIDPSTPLKISGMAVNVTKLELESDYIELDGTVTLAGSGVINLRSVDIKPEGSFLNGTITYSGVPLRFAGGTLQTATMTITDRGFRTSGKFTLPGNLTTVGAYGIVITSAGVTGIDSVTLAGASFSYNNFVVTPTSMRFPSGGISVDGTIDVPSFGQLVITDLTIGTDGTIRGGTISASTAGWTWKGYGIQIERVMFAAKGISIDGRLSIPDHGTAILTNLLIDSRGLISSGTLTTNNLTFTSGGFTVAVTGGSLTNADVTFSGTITLPNSWGTVGVTDLVLTTTGAVKSATLAYSSNKISLGGFVVAVTSLKLNGNGLAVSGSLTLPAAVTGRILVNDFVITPQGSFTTGSIVVQNVTARCGNFTATLDSARYANNEVVFSGTLPLPGQYGKVSIVALELETSGALEKGTLILQGASITHNGFIVNNLTGSLVSGNVVLGGSMTLPNGIGTATLAGLTLSGSSVVSYGSITLAGSKTITWQKYSVTVDSMQISQGLVTVSGSLTITSVGTVRAKDLGITPQGRFTGGTIIVDPNTTWTYNGFVIAVASAALQQTEVEISGTITIPNLNKSLTLSNVNFSAEGIPDGGTITYNGPPFAYKGYQLMLNAVTFVKGGVAGTATFAFGGSSGSATITISSTGSVGVTEFSVKNVNLTYGGFGIENVSVQMVGDSVRYTGTLNIPSVGSFTVQNMTVSTTGTVIDPGTVTFSARTFSYGSYMISVDSVQFHANMLGLTGSIQLPANKGIVRVADLLVSTAGKLTGGTISTDVKISHAGYTLTPQRIQWEGDGIEMDATFTIPQAQGVFAIKDFEIGLTGVVKLASIVYSGPDITFGGFTLKSVIIHTADLTDLSVDGTVDLPPSVGGDAIVTGLRFMTGDVSVQKIIMQNASLKYNSFTIAVDSITYANKLMVVTGKIGLPAPYGTLGIVGLAFDSQGSIQGGTITAQNVKMTYQGFVLTVTNAAMGTDRVLTLNGSVALPNTTGTMTLTGFKMDGTRVVDMGKAIFTGSTITWKSYTVTVDTVELLEKKLLFDGSVKLGANTTIRGENLLIGINGEVLGGAIDVSGLDSLRVGGFVVNLSNVQASDAGLTATGSITFPNNYGTLTATMLSISTDGKIADGPWIYTPAAPIMYNGATLTIQSVMLRSGSLTATATLLLPNKLTTVTANDVTISYPWNLTVGSITVANASFTYNGYTFTLDAATYSGSDLVINGTVDASTLGKAKFTGVKISMTGQFSGGTVAYSNAWKWGNLDVVVAKATYDWEGSNVSITGSVTLPQGMGNASVDSLVINTVTGAISNANVRATGTYTYGGRTFTATVQYANNEIELDGKIDLSQANASYISVSGLDISVTSGAISGGTFKYVGPALTFGDATVTINSVVPTLKSSAVTATVDLPGNLGTAIAENAAFDLNGSFKIDSVLFYGQSLNYNGFGFTVTHGVLTSKMLRVDVLATVGGVSFGIDSLIFTAGKFSGGRLDFSMTKISYKGYTLKIHSAIELPSGWKVSADFALPESKGFGRINGINICTTGFDFSAAQIDWSSLPNLLPPGFSFTITKAEFVEGGFDLTGTLTLSSFFNLNLDGLLVTPNRINLDSAHIQVGNLKVGPYQFAGLTFDFKSMPTWLVHMNGTVKLPGNFEGFTLDGTVDGNQNFQASLIAKTKDPILIGDSGTELIGAGGAIKKAGADYSISLIGIFAPVGMQKTLNGDGTLTIDANGKISGVLDVKLFDMFTMAKATMVIDIPTKKFTISGKAGIHNILSYDGLLNVDAKPFKASGSGNVEIDGIALAKTSFLMDTRLFTATGQLKIPDPAGNITLVDVDGTITVEPAKTDATMAGTISLLGYKVASGSLTVSPDSLAASGQINLGVATGDFNFLATQAGGASPNTPASGGGSVVPDVAGFLRDHPDDIGSIDLAIDVIQAEYPDIYQELLKDRNDIAQQEISMGGVGKKFGPGSVVYNLAKLRAQSIAQHVTAIVDLAGLDPNEFESSIQTWLLGHSGRPVLQRASWASNRPPLLQTPELYATLTAPGGRRFTLPLWALTPSDDGSPRQFQTLDLTDAYRSREILLPDWSADPVYACEGDFAGMLNETEAEPFAGFKLKSFTATVAIKFRGLTFDQTTVTIDQGTYQGKTKVTIPGIGSGTVTFTGDKTGVTSFSGNFNVTIHGYSLSDASVSYSFNGSKATLSISGSTSFIGSTFSASASVSETNGSFSVDSFSMRGAISVKWKLDFGFKWKIFHVHIKKTLDINFGSATFSYRNSSLQGSVSYCIDFPWPIHKQCIGFDVDISPHNVELGFDLFGRHTLDIGY